MKPELEIQNHWAFDLDGTLVDSFGPYFVALEQIFADHGVKFLPEHRLPALTHSVPVFVAEKLGPEAAPAALVRLQAQSNQDAEHIRAFEGVLPFLESLKSRGVKVAIWTNRERESTDLILKHAGLLPLIDFSVTGTCMTNRKPHPEGMELISRQFNLPPSQITMVGDHDIDMLAAKAAGARAVRAAWHGHWDVAACPHADAQFANVADFAAWAKQF